MRPLLQAPFSCMAKAKAITSITLLTYFRADTSMSRNAKAWKFKRALLQKEEPCRGKTL